MLQKVFTYRLFLAIFLFFALITLSACGKNNGQEEASSAKKKVEVQEISRQSQAAVSLKASGSVEPKQYSVIRSLTPGTIQFLVPVGQTVRTGDPLFFISDSGIESAYFNASQSLRQTEMIGQQRIRQAELALNSAKSRLDLARSQRQNSSIQADQAVKTSEDSALVAYNSAYNSLNQALSFLSIGNVQYDKYRSNKEEFYYFKDINAINSAFKIQTIALFPKAVDSFVVLEPLASQRSINSDLEKMQAALLDMKKLLDSTVLLLQNSAHDAYSEYRIVAEQAIVTGLQIEINQHVAAIIGSSNAIANAQSSRLLSADQLQGQLDLAEIDYGNSELALLSVREGVELELNMVRSQFDQAAYQYRNLSLPSPFSGTILSHYVREGEQISPGREILELGDLTIVEINFYLDAALAQALSINQEVLINGLYRGLISEIQPSGDLRSGKVSVKAQSQEAGNLSAGSIAEVELNLLYQDIDAIIVPLKSVNVEASGNYVFVIGEREKVEQRRVVLGEVYGDKVSIVSGLDQNDRLILLDGVFISAGDEVEVLN
ncbi:MAG: efflux RND transporter periplasmic adaptor subunit [Patescibacteria group bacterium]|nr:efflux RND transporter periplasmic adaptor subunit [Patescibacteria group bacterium]